MLPRPDQLDTLWRIYRHHRVSREKLLAFQNRKLRRVIKYAYRDVPYYRRLFDEAGVKPEDIRMAADLAALPITTKNDLRSQPREDILASWAEPERILTFDTSGSSGEPFDLSHAPFEKFLLKMITDRGRRRRGRRWGDKMVYIGLGRKMTARKGRWLLFILPHKLGIRRRYLINCKQPAEKIVDALERIDPDIVSGYPSVLCHVAPLVAKRRERINPRLVTTGSETLLPHMRKTIEECFGAPVHDGYGTVEFNGVAAQCPKTGLYHVFDDNIVFEILRDGHPVKEGERGEVVATALHQYAMPFIRYRLADVVTKGPESCPCGEPFSTLLNIQGRMIDYFPLPDGRTIHHYELLTPLLGDAPGGEDEWIRQYQFVQESKERMLFRIAPMDTPPEGGVEEIRLRAAEFLGPEVDLQIELVDSIDFEPSGKFRIGISHVKSNYDEFKWDRTPETAPVE